VRHTFRSFTRDERGTSLLEFTLCIAVVLTTVFGIMDVSRAIYVDHYVVWSARQGSRYASVRGSAFAGKTCAAVTTSGCAATAANVTAYVKSLAPTGTSLSNLTVTSTWPGTDGSGAVCTNPLRTSNAAGCLVTVKVVYSYGFTLPFLPTGLMALTSSSAMTISQ
jgi:Flp pilus assembly protein TadG